jgi:hypothetical protein
VGKARSLCGLPVDGLETVLEVAGWAELPLADNGPDSSTSCDARACDDKTNDHRFWQEGGALILGSVRGLRSRGSLCDKHG